MGEQADCQCQDCGVPYGPEELIEYERGLLVCAPCAITRQTEDDLRFDREERARERTDEPTLRPGGTLAEMCEDILSLPWRLGVRR